MFRQLIYGTIAITAFASISFGQKSPVKPIKATILYCDSAMLNSYKTALANCNKANKRVNEYFNDFFSIINKFNGKPLDTTIITSGKLDEKGMLCVIRTRVYLYDSTVFVESSLAMNHKLLWKNSIKNPASWCSIDLPMSFDSGAKSLWVYFINGVCFGAPEFVNNSATALGKPNTWADSWFKDMCLDDLKKKGIRIDKQQYRAYLTNFKGDLFAYGDFISKERLYIWYSPAKCFILFYAP